MTDPTTAQDPANTPATILIIDDDPIIVQLLAKALTPLGRVVFATNGLDGLEAAARHRPRVALIDADLPDITGFEIVKRFRNDRELYGITLLMISAHSAAVVSEGAEHAGADGFLSKPIDENELRSLVGKALSKPVAPVPSPLQPVANGFDMDLVDSLDEEMRKASTAEALAPGRNDALLAELTGFIERVRADVTHLRQNPQLADSSVLHHLGGIEQLCGKIAQSIGYGR